MSNKQDLSKLIANQALPELASLLLTALQASEPTQNIPIPIAQLADFNTLSRREREVLRLIGDGLTTRQIAERLFISPHTVNNQRAQISQKLSLRGAFSLLQFAQRYRQWL